MIVTNKLNLPDGFHRAVINDQYSKGESDFSATELLKPSRQWALLKIHDDKISEDCSDRVWSLLGQAAHVICERANKNELVEKRYFAKVDKYIISCAVDSLELSGSTLSDYKITTVYKIRKNERPDADWINQLNIQSYILSENGIDVKSLRIIAILRDWSNRHRDDESMPDRNIVVVNIPLHSKERNRQFIQTRIASHLMARQMYDSNNLPKCSKEERWATDDQWALMQKGKKRAVKLFNDYSMASSLRNELGGNDYYIESRPGESKRCKDYCAANSFCTQFKDSIRK